MQVISVIGASGFIGRHLLRSLASRPDLELRVLSRDPRKLDGFDGRLTIVQGDLLDAGTLRNLCVPGCTVINLAYLANGSQQDNIRMIRALAKACAESGVRRLIHCSTVVVAGPQTIGMVDESTSCKPLSAYEIAKLEIERCLLEDPQTSFEVTVLRPGAVFGPGGKNLLKLADDLTGKSRIRNYLKSSLFGRRSMNLVCVDNVVAALIFLADQERKLHHEIFIVSDDESPLNNYRDIEAMLIQRLGLRPYGILPASFGKGLLSLALRLAGRTQFNPDLKYSDCKLQAWGFRKLMTIEREIDLFIEWYLSK